MHDTRYTMYSRPREDNKCKRRTLMEGHVKRTFGGPWARECPSFFRAASSDVEWWRSEETSISRKMLADCRKPAQEWVPFSSALHPRLIASSRFFPLQIYFIPLVCILGVPFERGFRRSSFLHFYPFPFSVTGRFIDNIISTSDAGKNWTAKLNIGRI